MANRVKRQSSASVATQSASKKPKMSTKENAKKSQHNTKDVDDSKEELDDVEPQAAQWRDSFLGEVHEKENDILKRLEGVKGKLQADQQKFEAAVLDILRQAILPVEAVKPDAALSSGDNSKLKVSVTAVGDQALGDGIADLIGASQKLIKQYKRLATKQPHQSRAAEIRSTFRKDKQAALATIAAGRKVATRDIQNMLVDRFHEVRDRSDVTLDEDATGRMLLAKGEVGEDGGGGLESVGWGTVALDMKKGIDRLERAVYRQ